MEGKSTVWSGKGSKAGKVKVYAIDPHIGSSESRKIHGGVRAFEKFKTNIRMAGVEGIIVPIGRVTQCTSFGQMTQGRFRKLTVEKE